MLGEIFDLFQPVPIRPMSEFERRGISSDFATVYDRDENGEIDINAPAVVERMNKWAKENPPRYSSGELAQVGDVVMYQGRGEAFITGEWHCDTMHGARWFLTLEQSSSTSNSAEPSQMTLIRRAPPPFVSGCT